MEETEEISFMSPLKYGVGKSRYIFPCYYKFKFGIEKMNFGDIFIDKKLFSNGEEIIITLPYGEKLDLTRYHYHK